MFTRIKLNIAFSITNFGPLGTKFSGFGIFPFGLDGHSISPPNFSFRPLLEVGKLFWTNVHSHLCIQITFVFLSAFIMFAVELHSSPLITQQNAALHWYTCPAVTCALVTGLHNAEQLHTARRVATAGRPYFSGCFNLSLRSLSYWLLFVWTRAVIRLLSLSASHSLSFSHSFTVTQPLNQLSLIPLCLVLGV